MFTIALIGPDGAGKTTISRQIDKSLPLPVKYIYMGVNVESSNTMLPTTRLVASLKKMSGKKTEWQGPPAPGHTKPAPKGIVKGSLRGIRAFLRLVNRVGEECYRQVLTWYYELRGNIVLYDRHFFVDYYSYDIAPSQDYRPVTRRIHGWFLKNIYPKPDLVIYLDAPAETLFKRKGEGTIETLEWRRQEYLAMRKYLKNFEVVDASQSINQVASDVIRIIWDFYRSRSKTNPKVPNVQS